MQASVIAKFNPIVGKRGIELLLDFIKGDSSMCLNASTLGLTLGLLKTPEKLVVVAENEPFTLKLWIQKNY